MTELRIDILQALRDMGRKGAAPSQMLREILHRLAPDPVYDLTLIRYMKEAFCVQLSDVTPIGGWASDGGGELDDARLDELIMPAIVAKRPIWNSLGMASSA
jgi:hypothetical protein